MTLGPVVADLCGTWRVHPADADLEKDFVEPGFADDHWAELAVPGHWRACPGLADSDGPVLYRRRFEAPPVDTDQRAFLELDGAFYYTDVWLDGAYLGATEGYFQRHSFEVSDSVAESRDHVLSIAVACPPQTDPAAKRIVTGVFSHWDDIEPQWNPGGLWRPVRVRSTGAVRIARCRVTCIEASETRGRLAIDLTLDAAGLGADAEAAVDALVTGPGNDPIAEHLSALTLTEGVSHRRIEVRVENPPRWWPHRLGEAPMCRLQLAVRHGGAVSDSVELSTAFREVRMRNLELTVNGERIFVMGAAQGPTRMAIAEATAREMQADVEAAIGANLDLVRVHGHVARTELYEAADRAGLLLWQDFPLQWGYAHGVRRPALRQATEMVDALAHHPSIACWCAHDEPVAATRPPGARTALRALTSWNRDVLDHAVARAIQRADGTRAVLAHSGVMPGPSSRGTDSHLSFGWKYGRAADLAGWLRTWPRLARWVSDIGAQAVPEGAAFLEAGRWPALDWAVLEEHHALDHELIARHTPPEAFPDVESWVEATQVYQAALIQLQIEDLRRLKNRPTTGFCYSRLADGFPAVTRALLDHRRHPKLGYAALRNACRPVLPTIDPRDGSVHIVNELREAMRAASITVTVDGEISRFAGDAELDATTFVGRVEVSEAERVEVELLHATSGPVVNTYDAAVLALGRSAA